ncbi:phosphoprotein [Soybean blotchy mosaic virus]|nr:phosphoprotein [Soybean blotchy mosaic virus]UUC10112.1 phosphoprotein [Soybean blotchy mosaic virus]UUC10118.1 phosphoprotein [Soybean blotchy mosaic virus]
MTSELFSNGTPKLTTDAFGEYDLEGDDDFSNRPSQLRPEGNKEISGSSDEGFKQNSPEPAISVTEAAVQFKQPDDDGEEYFDDEISENLHDRSILDVRDLTTSLNFMCQQFGVKCEDMWLSHFKNCLANHVPVFESHLQTWVTAIRQERAAGAVHELRELTTGMSTQVSKLAGQVKSLQDQVNSLTNINQIMTDSMIQMSESQQTHRDNISSIIEKLNQISLPSTSSQKVSHQVIVHDPPRAHPEIIHKVDKKDRKEEIVTGFLVAMQTDPAEIKDPLLRLAVESLFDLDMMLSAMTNGIPDNELPEVYELIRKKLQELSD